MSVYAINTWVIVSGIKVSTEIMEKIHIVTVIPLPLAVEEV